jgi:hypothetical protein
VSITPPSRHRRLGRCRHGSDLGACSKSAEAGTASRRCRNRASERPVLLPDCDLYRDQCRAELGHLVGACSDALITIRTETFGAES